MVSDAVRRLMQKLSRNEEPARRRVGTGTVISAMVAAMLVLPLLARAQAGHARGHILVKFKDSATAAQISAALHWISARSEHSLGHAGVHWVDVQPGTNEASVVAAIQNRPGVQFAELDKYLKLAQTPNDPSYPSQWHLPNINAPSAWSVTSGSSNVIVADLDSGCDPTHPDLAPNLVPGWNFYDNNSDTHDVLGHGTMTMGCIGAAGNNGIGVASVSWTSKLMPLRVCDTTGYSLYSTISSALQYAADHGAKVANISIEGAAGSASVQSGAQYLWSKGGVTCISAGNNGNNPGFAACPYIVAVSGTDQNNALASFSEYGAYITVSAPAVGIYTTTNGGGYGSGDGTSFCAPITAGVVALEFAANPGLTPSQAVSALESSATDLGAAGWDQYFGYGKVNAYGAVQAAMSIQAPQPPTVATPAVASANLVTGKTVNLSVLGADVNGESLLTYTWSASGPAAVSYSANGTNAAKNTTATFSAAGSYSFSVTIKDNAGLTCTSGVNVTVSQTATSVSVSPSSASVSEGKSQQFASSVKDQFGSALSSQPACTWNVTGGGSIASTGLFTASMVPGGPFTVSATASSMAGNGSVSVTAPDTTVPTVSITSPTGGRVSGTITVSATASDNVGVVRVELWVDGKLSSTDTASPWSLSLNTNGWKKGSSHTLQCKAYDAAGNVGISQIVTVSK